MSITALIISRFPTLTDQELSPLANAAAGGHLPVVEYLIRQGASPPVDDDVSNGCCFMFALGG